MGKPSQLGIEFCPLNYILKILLCHFWLPENEDLRLTKCECSPALSCEKQPVNNQENWVFCKFFLEEAEILTLFFCVHLELQQPHGLMSFPSFYSFSELQPQLICGKTYCVFWAKYHKENCGLFSSNRNIFCLLFLH